MEVREENDEHRANQVPSDEFALVPVPEAAPSPETQDLSEGPSNNDLPSERNTTAEEDSLFVPDDVELKVLEEPGQREEQAVIGELAISLQNRVDAVASDVATPATPKEEVFGEEEPADDKVGDETDQATDVTDEDEDDAEDADAEDADAEDADAEDADAEDADAEDADAEDVHAKKEGRDAEPSLLRDDVAEKPKKERKSRRARAKTAQEFFDRKFEDEQAKKATQSGRKRKRKVSQFNPRPYKQRKTGPSIPRWEDDEAGQARSHLLSSVGDDFELSFTTGEAPSMGMIRAATKASQFQQIKANIPEGCDMRRTASQKHDLTEAAKSFGYRKVRAIDGRWRLGDMKSSLHSYQLTLAAWMAKRECGKTPPWGGLVADEMGMGKTIVSLAIVVGNPPSSQTLGDYCRATLVVVPNQSLANQWLEEIQKHCSENMSQQAVIFPGREPRQQPFWEKRTLVITTYHELLRHWVKLEDMKALKSQCGSDKDAYHRGLTEKLGVLYHIDWYRVILDEAHQIKNMAARTTRACCYLNAKFRWALSGTPLSNTAEELFPYLQFLGCNFTRDLKDFRAKYVQGPEGRANFEALVSIVMYRRTKKDTMLGCKILDIPESQIVDLWVPLAAEEKLLSDAILSYYDGAIMRSSSKGQKDKNGNLIPMPRTQKEKDREMAALRAMYTMLRQACSHIYNTETWLRKSLPLFHMQILVKDLEKQGGKVSVLDHLLAAEHQPLSQFSEGIKALQKLKSPTLSGCIKIDEQFLMIELEKYCEEQSCPICNKTPMAPSHSTCGHLYCETCLFKNMKSQKSRQMSCLHPGCNDVIQNPQNMMTIGTVFDTVDGEKWESKNERGKDSNNVGLVRDRSKNGLFATSEYQPSMWVPPSSKLTAAMAVLLDWKTKHPDDKVIVFTTFLQTGKILGLMLQEAGICDFLYFYGEMSQKQKAKSIIDFKEKPEQKIMIMGLKCGALGLNLTCANRIIIIDPWWNNTVEQQAFGRVWRLGQKKVSYMVRIKTDSTVDQRIAQLQKAKSADVDRALQDDGFVPREIDDFRLRQLFSVPGADDDDSEED